MSGSVAWHSAGAVLGTATAVAVGGGPGTVAGAGPGMLPSPLLPLHVGEDPTSSLLLVAAVPLAGLVEGLAAGLVTLPAAYRLRGWLLQPSGDRTERPAHRHLLAAVGLGVVHAVLTVLVGVALPADLLGALALRRPSLPWVVPATLAAGLLWAVLWLANQPVDDERPLSLAARRLAVGFLAALVAVDAVAAEVALAGL